MHPTLLTVLFAVAFSLTASAAPTKYDKTKAMYEQAKAPASEASLMAQIPRISDCAEFKDFSPDTVFSNKLMIVTHTTSSAGPEFPSQELKGIGLSRADSEPRDFFRTYKAALKPSGYSIQYEYDYTEFHCGVDSDGSEHCTRSHETTIKDTANIRVSKQYIHYTREPLIYGYCWF